jgi:hypothetical protein
LGHVPTVHGLEFAYSLYLIPPDRLARGDLKPGTTERFAIGPVTAVLVPRALERPNALSV